MIEFIDFTVTTIIGLFVGVGFVVLLALSAHAFVFMLGQMRKMLVANKTRNLRDKGV